MATTSSSSKLIRTSRRALNYDNELDAHTYRQAAPDTFGPDHPSQFWNKDWSKLPPTCHPRPGSSQQNSNRLPRQPLARSSLYHVRYDNEERLTAWSRSDGNQGQTWSLSLVGDWNTHAQTGTNPFTQARVHGLAHEFLAFTGTSTGTLTYDVKGNATSRPATLAAPALNLTWDFANQLFGADTNGSPASQEVSFRYDVLGRRVGRIEGASSLVFVQSGQQTIADYDAGQPPTKPNQIYVYGSYIDEPVARRESENLAYFHRNQQYSIVALSDSIGAVIERYSYTAYGQPTIYNAAGTVLAASAFDNRYTYTGREWDQALGLHYFRARWYDPMAGRFISRDPLEFIDGLNLYHAYFAIGSTDAMGLFWGKIPCCCWFFDEDSGGIWSKTLSFRPGSNGATACHEYAKARGYKVFNVYHGRCIGHLDEELPEAVPDRGIGLLDPRALVEPGVNVYHIFKIANELRREGIYSSRCEEADELIHEYLRPKNVDDKSCRKIVDYRRLSEEEAELLERICRANIDFNAAVGGCVSGGGAGGLLPDGNVPKYGATPSGRPYTKHYGEVRGPQRNIPGSVVDNTIDTTKGVPIAGGKTVYYDPGNKVTVVTGDGGCIVSVHKGPPRKGQY